MPTRDCDGTKEGTKEAQRKFIRSVYVANTGIGHPPFAPFQVLSSGPLAVAWEVHSKFRHRKSWSSAGRAPVLFAAVWFKASWFV